MYKIHTLVFIRAAADINRLINFSAIDYDNQEPSFDGNKTIIYNAGAQPKIFLSRIT